MKRNRKLLKAVSVACALMITTVGVYAGGKAVGYFGSSSSIYKYKDVPTIEQMEKETGIKRSFVEEFANGYKFDGAMPEDLNTTDAKGDPLDKTKGMNLTYKKDGEGDIYVSVHKRMPSEPEVEEDNSFEKNCRTVNVNGTNVVVSTVKMRFVPEGYKLSDEEKQLKESGDLLISYGSREVEDKIGVSALWEKDGVRYSLSYLGKEAIPEQTLIEMAEELI